MCIITTNTELYKKITPPYGRKSATDRPKICSFRLLRAQRVGHSALWLGNHLLEPFWFVVFFLQSIVNNYTLFSLKYNYSLYLIFSVVVTITVLYI